MDKNELIKLILDRTDGYVSYPFNKPGRKEPIQWSVIKHQSNNKILAMVFVKDDQLMMNIKLKPEQNDMMRDLQGVEPGYHMNKRHWTTITINHTEVSMKELENIVLESARLTE